MFRVIKYAANQCTVVYIIVPDFVIQDLVNYRPQSRMTQIVQLLQQIIEMTKSISCNRSANHVDRDVMQCLILAITLVLRSVIQGQDVLRSFALKR
jgi:hypothetical protein